MAFQSHCLCQGFFSSFTLSVKAGSLFFTSHSSFSFVVPLFWLLFIFFKPQHLFIINFYYSFFMHVLFMLLILIIHFFYSLLLLALVVHFFFWVCFNFSFLLFVFITCFVHLNKIQFVVELIITKSQR
jgi:hypothetical protein